MFRRLRVVVVVPAYNEADKIADTLASVPSYIDQIVLVDDGSTDGTLDAALGLARANLAIVRHERNRGVGSSIASGYQRALELGAEVIAVMAGDAQMDPLDLKALLEPLAAGLADYVKGNRFLWPGIARVMPPLRIIGNGVLSWLTRLATGNWRLFDSQCGYTVISRQAL